MRAARQKGEGVPGPSCPHTYRDMVRRGSKTAKARVSRFLIEGEHVTYEQMAAKLGVSLAAAKKRFEKAKAQPGAVTWESLS